MDGIEQPGAGNRTEPRGRSSWCGHGSRGSPFPALFSPYRPYPPPVQNRDGPGCLTINATEQGKGLACPSLLYAPSALSGPPAGRATAARLLSAIPAARRAEGGAKPVTPELLRLPSHPFRLKLSQPPSPSLKTSTQHPLYRNPKSPSQAVHPLPPRYVPPRQPVPRVLDIYTSPHS